MPDTNDEIQKLLTDVQQYLKEERELFGDYIYPEPSLESPMTSKKQTTPKEQSASKPSGEQDLFGDPAMPASQRKPGAIAESLMPYPNEPWVKATSLDALNACFPPLKGGQRYQGLFPSLRLFRRSQYQ